MSNHQSMDTNQEAQLGLRKNCHLLALPAELRLEIYNHYFADCISNPRNDNGSALLGACRTIRIEAIPECEKHIKAQLTILDHRYTTSTERYLTIRARFAGGLHPAFLSGMVLVSQALDEISREMCALRRTMRENREVWERGKAEDWFSLSVLEEKGNGDIVWA